MCLLTEQSKGRAELWSVPARV